MKINPAETISHCSRSSQGWPTILRKSDGSLILVYSGGRDGHYCPFGRIEMMTSHDEGETWSWPRVILDTDLDDRDAGIVETSTGTLLVTTFSHAMYEDIITELEQGRSVPFIAEGQVRGALLVPERLPAWKAARDRVSSEERKRQTGEWMIRSTDGGRSWSAHYRCLVSSPHGPIRLKDGRLLYPGKTLRDIGDCPKESIGVCESSDDGVTWRWLGQIPEIKEYAHSSLHELHAVEAANGIIITHIRNHNETNKFEILQSISTDGGYTWCKPYPTGIWGFPSHLLKLRDDRLLMTYSHRREPYGNYARISRDHGKTWSPPVNLSPDSDCPDFGYPSTAELSDGTLLTIWYEAMNGNSKTFLRQVKWDYKMEAIP